MGISLGNTPERLDAGEIAAIMFPDMVRQGPHAYGWMSYNEKTNVISYDKYVGRSDTAEAYKNVLYGVDPKAKWMVGHTRFATHGNPEDLRNDHPIPHGKIIGVHNGVLSNHEEILALTGREDPKTVVDSEAIFAAVNKWGPTKGLRRVHGNMVAIYANRERPHVLHIARTHGRQVTIGITTRGNLIWASDKSTLELLQPDIKFVRFTTISENRLILIRDGKIIQRFTFRKPEHHAPVRKFTPPPARVILPTVRPGQGVPSTTVFDLERSAATAVRRGEILFPKGQPVKKATTTKKKGKKKKSKAHAENKGVVSQQKRVASDKLYYFNGILMTRDEYEDALLHPELYPEDSFGMIRKISD